jgi:hypothetical protein
MTLTFQRHDLSVSLFNVCAVSVQYAGCMHAATDDEYAPAKTPADVNRYPSIKSGDWPAFASLVNIEWRALDGQTLDCTLDLNEIFKDKRVLHTENPARLYAPSPIAGDVPTVIIELDDRTVNVYMFVALQIMTDNTNPPKRVIVNNTTLAYTHKY